MPWDHLVGCLGHLGELGCNGNVVMNYIKGREAAKVLSFLAEGEYGY